ncbi:MAG TPA: MarR family winged helix-turn-helix transcriptional regulator [Acidimicrobiales bacterium]
MLPNDQDEDLQPQRVSCASEFESVEQALTRLVRLSDARRTSSPAQTPRNRLDRAAYALLTRLEECPATRLTELAALMEIDLSTASRQVRSLQDRGLISRVEDPHDQRTARLELTEQGREMVVAARVLRVGRIASRLSKWQQRDIEELARLLSDLVSSFTDQPQLEPVASPIPLSARRNTQLRSTQLRSTQLSSTQR